MIDNTKEYILCAAIKRKEPKRPTTLYHNDIHLIEIGMRHCDIRDRFPGELMTGPSAQGFYTSRARFVSRDEGEVIARACGQVSGKLLGSILTSEDLY